MARVETTLLEGRLITKTEAISRLDRFDVPSELVAEIAARRQGVDAHLSVSARTRRAVLARRLVRSGIERLVGTTTG